MLVCHLLETVNKGNKWNVSTIVVSNMTDCDISGEGVEEIESF